ncbi:hypothetical protein BJV77DRAFT_978822 [Russula vinacea]|nr:hypothetical protein BJV77DRAFT_978822 [Russula vinacea]
MPTAPVAPAAAIPAWFDGADDITDIKAVLVSMKRMDAKAWNIHCNDGHQRQYRVMPFLNGDIPAQAPHNLPELQNVDVIRGLNGQQTASYMNGYGLGNVHLLIADQKRLIGQEIGCPVII